MKKILFVVVLASCSLTSCIVSKKKYDDLSRRKSALEAEKEDCENNLKTKQAELDKANDLIDGLSNDTSHLGKELRASQETYQKLLSNTNKIASNNQAELSKLSKSLAEREVIINKLALDVQEREKRVRDLESILARKDSAVKALKDKLTKSLLGFKDKDITVEIKNGKVYVSLSEQLLFKSGKTNVDEKGIEALKKLAAAVKDDKDLNIMVEGHTDDVPISKGTACMEDNWDLSVLRATSITKILVSNGFSPENIMPSGHGEFKPLVEGKTPDARRLNRRTDIIISPNLDELFNLLNK